MRGTDVGSCTNVPPRRFIPACAGNSRSTSLRMSRTSVHPRVCGEQLAERLPRPCHRGSSPRVRGTAVVIGEPAALKRFIPACAGNRSGPRRGRGHQAVHPRVCGEQILGTLGIGGVTGSSPRVRGTVDMALGIPASPRFIPACAGNRLSQLGSVSSSAVHPRVCGEQ